VERVARFHREFDAFAALSAAAVVTTSLTIGTGVVLPAQRDVFHTAKQVATVDHLCGGRFVFGVGTGWITEQMRNHGVDPRTRGARLDEHLRALDAIWTRDEAEFHGTYLDFDPVFSWPKPVQAHVPVYVGGESTAAVPGRQRSVTRGCRTPSWTRPRSRHSSRCATGTPRAPPSRRTRSPPTTCR